MSVQRAWVRQTRARQVAGAAVAGAADIAGWFSLLESPLRPPHQACHVQCEENSSTFAAAKPAAQFDWCTF